MGQCRNEARRAAGFRSLAHIHFWTLLLCSVCILWVSWLSHRVVCLFSSWTCFFAWGVDLVIEAATAVVLIFWAMCCPFREVAQKSIKDGELCTKDIRAIGCLYQILLQILSNQMLLCCQSWQKALKKSCYLITVIALYEHEGSLISSIRNPI